MKGKNVIISINTETRERKAIEIDGVRYELTHPDDMSFREFVWMENTGEDVQRLLKGRLTEDRVDKVVGLIEDAVNKVVIDLPKMVLKKLSDRQKMAIINAWGNAYKEENEKKKEERQKGSGETSGE